MRSHVTREHRERQRSDTPLPCARFESIDDLCPEAGAELGGIGSNTQIWTFTGRANIPFSAR